MSTEEKKEKQERGGPVITDEGVLDENKEVEFRAYEKGSLLITESISNYPFVQQRGLFC